MIKQTGSAIILSLALTARGQVVMTDLPPAKPLPQKVVALTFDDGPNPATTPQVLAELERRHVVATFFVQGMFAQRPSNQWILQKMLKDGFEIGNHGFSHANLTGCGKAEFQRQIRRTSEAIKRATGETPTLMRPPGGAVNQQVIRQARELGLKTVLWSLNPVDWSDRNAENVKNYVLNNVASGDVVLLHDIHPTTMAAVPRILDGLIKKGFCLVTVSRLLEINQELAGKNELTWAKKAAESFPGLAKPLRLATKH